MYNINYFKTQDDAVNSTPNFPCVVKLATSDKVGYFNPSIIDTPFAYSFISKGNFITLDKKYAYMVCKYNIINIGTTDILYQNGDVFSAMEVDGIAKSLNKTVVFNTDGVHTVRFLLVTDFYRTNANNFNSIASLISCVLPHGITSISGFTFYRCTNLVSITIPSTVDSILKNAFDYCGRLSSIIFQGTIAQWKKISRRWEWHTDVPAKTVTCSDGTCGLDDK